MKTKKIRIAEKIFEELKKIKEKEGKTYNELIAERILGKTREELEKENIKIRKGYKRREKERKKEEENFWFIKLIEDTLEDLTRKIKKYWYGK